MHADPEVMHDYGGPISRVESDAKLDRYASAYCRHGFCRWAVSPVSINRQRRPDQIGSLEKTSVT
jgi:hypothetical protein